MQGIDFTVPANPIPQIIQAVLVVLLTIIATRLVDRFTKKKRVISYDVISIPLIRFTPSEKRGFQLLVQRALLEPGVTDPTQAVPVTNAFGFEIRCTNESDEEIKEPVIAIALHPATKIIETEVHPNHPVGYNVQITPDASDFHKLNVIPPHINAKETLVIRIVSTGNEDRTCDVVVHAPGVKGRKHNEETHQFLRQLRYMTIPFGILGFGFRSLAGRYTNILRRGPKTSHPRRGTRLALHWHHDRGLRCHDGGPDSSLAITQRPTRPQAGRLGQHECVTVDTILTSGPNLL
jgi:hypothetical protein